MSSCPGAYVTWIRTQHSTVSTWHACSTCIDSIARSYVHNRGQTHFGSSWALYTLRVCQRWYFCHHYKYNWIWLRNLAAGCLRMTTTSRPNAFKLLLLHHSCVWVLLYRPLFFHSTASLRASSSKQRCDCIICMSMESLSRLC